ncbi:hypothetical protein [Flavobacterium sp.]|uniref:hypothetical protein n=1 Tax=Flavobacterium sp. TaxID=239 RepID=UPI0039E707FA
MIHKQNQKREVNYLFKAPGGTYGKGAKQTTEDDFVELMPNAHIPSIPHTPSVSIYHRKTKSRFNYNQTLNFFFIVCSLSIIILKFLIDDLFITTHEKNLEDLISKLCFAFIGSYIFYNVVTKTTDKLKKKEAYAVICALIDSVIHNGENVKKWLRAGAGKDAQFSFRRNEQRRF